jgi:ABC-type transport system involved in Fe-S cluster assembly fused permease/ATPase subunit
MIQQTIDSLCGRDLGIVSIAHRLSTVRGAEKIYVLSHGALVESLGGATTRNHVVIKWLYNEGNWYYNYL